jgi:N-carbamoylputrescine amidase
MQRVESVRRIWPFLRDRRIDAYQDIGQRYLDSYFDTEQK